MTLRTCDCWKMVLQTLDQVMTSLMFDDVWWARPDIMKQLPTEGKKFKVVDGRKAELQMRKWFELLWVVCFVRTMWCNVFAVFANNEQTKCFFIYCSFLKDVEAVTFRLECQTYLSRFCWNTVYTVNTLAPFPLQADHSFSETNTDVVSEGSGDRLWVGLLMGSMVHSCDRHIAGDAGRR